MKSRINAFFAVLFSVLVMVLLKKAGYLAEVGIIWRCVLAGALAGGAALVLKYATQSKPEAGSEKSRGG